VIAAVQKLTSREHSRLIASKQASQKMIYSGSHSRARYPSTKISVAKVVLTRCLTVMTARISPSPATQEKSLPFCEVRTSLHRPLCLSLYSPFRGGERECENQADEIITVLGHRSFGLSTGQVIPVLVKAEIIQSKPIVTATQPWTTISTCSTVPPLPTAT
jgi:hypothetical protein